MLINLYNQLVFMSLIAGLLYLILKIFSTLTDKYFSVAWHYYSYLFISSFFIIPYYTLLSTLSKVNKWVNLKVDDWVLPSSRALSPPDDIISVTEKVVTLPEEINKIHSFFEFIPYVLMTGTLMFIIIVIVQNYKLKRRIYSVCYLMTDKEILKVLSGCKQELMIEKEIPVYICDYAHSPFISGIFRPRIVLPNIEFSIGELRYVFLHELTHWKNHDALLKYLLLLINVVHWFNPLAYMIRRDIDRFCESFCDKSVTNSMNNEERRQYSELILSVQWHLADQNINLSSAFSDKRKIERRVNMIMKTENSKKWIRIFAVVMTLALAFGGTVTVYAYANDKVIPSEVQTNVDTSLKEEVEIGAPLALTKAVTLQSQSGAIADSDIKTTSEVALSNEIGLLATYSYNWTVSANSYSQGSNEYYLREGDTVEVSGSWAETSSNIRIGLYDGSTLYYISGSGGSVSGSFQVPAAGNYKFMIRNMSDVDIHISGFYSL